MSPLTHSHFFFFFNDTATTEIYTLSLHDALPIWPVPTCSCRCRTGRPRRRSSPQRPRTASAWTDSGGTGRDPGRRDRKSTRLNSSHANISYDVFCLKKKKETRDTVTRAPV